MGFGENEKKGQESIKKALFRCYVYNGQQILSKSFFCGN